MKGKAHYGHRIAFSEDGYLFISSGERQKFDPAQDMNANLGKILRLHPDGSVPDDNPFADRGGVTTGTGPSFATRGTLTTYLSLCLNSLCGKWPRAGERLRKPNVLLQAYTARAEPYPPYPPCGFGEKLRVRGPYPDLSGDGQTDEI